MTRITPPKSLSERFDAFLFSNIFDDENFHSLSVMSVLARQGVDPWGEAARLTDMTREAARASLAARISATPEWQSQNSRLELDAARLVRLLPRKLMSTSVWNLRYRSNVNLRVCQVLALLMLMNLFIQLTAQSGAAIFPLSKSQARVDQSHFTVAKWQPE